jgi:hypothetical protein
LQLYHNHQHHHHNHNQNQYQYTKEHASDSNDIPEFEYEYVLKGAPRRNEHTLQATGEDLHSRTGNTSTDPSHAQSEAARRHAGAAARTNVPGPRKRINSQSFLKKSFMEDESEARGSGSQHTEEHDQHQRQ